VSAVLAATDTAWAYISAAYLIVFATLIAYAAFVIVRGRRAGSQLPAEERRWTK
jgi:hypothetical protein